MARKRVRWWLKDTVVKRKMVENIKRLCQWLAVKMPLELKAVDEEFSVWASPNCGIPQFSIWIWGRGVYRSYGNAHESEFPESLSCPTLLVDFVHGETKRSCTWWSATWQCPCTLTLLVIHFPPAHRGEGDQGGVSPAIEAEQERHKDTDERRERMSMTRDVVIKIVSPNVLMICRRQNVSKSLT